MQSKIEPVFVSFNKYLWSSSPQGAYNLMGGTAAKGRDINNKVIAIGSKCCAEKNPTRRDEGRTPRKDYNGDQRSMESRGGELPNGEWLCRAKRQERLGWDSGKQGHKIKWRGALLITEGNLHLTLRAVGSHSIILSSGLKCFHFISGPVLLKRRRNLQGDNVNTGKNR